MGVDACRGEGGAIWEEGIVRVVKRVTREQFYGCYRPQHGGLGMGLM